MSSSILLLPASAMFSADLYKNKLLVEVADGTLRLGVKKTTTSPTTSWTVFDNFELYYLGTEMPSAIEHISSENTHDESERIYDLAGRRLNGKPSSKGRYIRVICSQPCDQIRCTDSDRAVWHTCCT